MTDCLYCDAGRPTQPCPHCTAPICPVCWLQHVATCPDPRCDECEQVRPCHWCECDCTVCPDCLPQHVADAHRF